MEIQPVNERKKLFINTLLPIIYAENLKILEDRKKFLTGGANLKGKIFQGIFGQPGSSN